MKAINFKQIIVLALSIFIFGACSDREVEVFSSCNYDFSASPTTTNVEVNTDVIITLNVNKLGSTGCDTNYTVAYEVTKDNVATDNSTFTYSGNASNVSLGDSTGTFNANEIGVYKITFTANNTGADQNAIQTQTVTINVNYPPIELTLFEDNINRNKEVFVTQDANYTFNFSGGNPTNNDYSVLLTTTGDDLDPEITFLSLGTEVSPLQSPLSFRITPAALGIATYTITVSQDGISASQDFILTSKAPEFDLRLRLNGTEAHSDSTPSDTIDASNLESSNLRINIENFTTGFSGDQMNYTFAVTDGEFIYSEHSSNGINDTRGYPIPSSSFRYTIDAKDDGNGGYLTGIKEIIVTATNTEYGFSTTKSIWVDIVP